MTVDDFVTVLSVNPNTGIRVNLPDGSFVPAHFHVTEVGRVQKDFIDCGGTVRNSITCVLQVWIANDVDHRLDTTKLSKIIEKGTDLFGSMNVPIEIEYDNGLVSQYPLLETKVTPECVFLILGKKHTDCLAQDRCGVSLNVLADCSGSDCC